jgi:parallel beta-helix repeat protein
LETYDTGAIEVTQHDKDLRSGSTIRNNIVGDSIGYSSKGPKPVFLSHGIYLDSYAGGYTVTNNICYRTTYGGIMLQGGKDNRVVNNIFVDGSQYQSFIRNYAKNSTGQVFRRNIVYYTGPKAVLADHGKLQPNVVQVDHNLYFRVGGDDPTVRNFDAEALVADPCFVDAAHDNYALRPDSPAFRLGFEAIDTSHVGPRTKPCRCAIRPAAKDFNLANATVE